MDDSPLNSRRRIIGVGTVVAVVVGVVLWALLRTGPPVEFLGDSITVVSGNAIRDRLGRDYQPTLDAVLGISAEQMVATAQKASARHPEQVVVELGTNDVLHHSTVAAATTALTQIVAQFPSARCIHLVNVNTHITDAGRPVVADAGLINAAIVKLAAGDHRIDVVDWNRITSEDVSAHPPTGTLTSDTVHPNAAGQKALADAIGTALDHCGS